MEYVTDSEHAQMRTNDLQRIHEADQRDLQARILDLNDRVRRLEVILDSLIRRDPPFGD